MLTKWPTGERTDVGRESARCKVRLFRSDRALISKVPRKKIVGPVRVTAGYEWSGQPDDLRHDEKGAFSKGVVGLVYWLPIAATSALTAS